MKIDEIQDIERLRFLAKGYAAECEEVMQTLGKALGYPWFKDDQKNFPGSTEEHGVCVGEHTPATIADEAARRIRRLDRVVADKGWVKKENNNE